MVLASASDAERHDPALAEIVGVRLLLVNVLGPVAAGEKMAPEAFDKMLDQISEVKHQLAAKLQQQAGEKPQREKPSGGRAVIPFFRWRVYGAREPRQASPLRSDRRAAHQERAGLTRLPLRSCVASS